jgi:uncharacterized protein (TIGR03083 family)
MIMDMWRMIADQRRHLADIFESLDDAQWMTPSLCAGWTMREIAGHLVSPHELGTVKMLLYMAACGFSFDKMVDKVARQFARRPTYELVRLLRIHAESRWTPPGLGPEAPFGDIVVHTQDVCRGLNIKPILDPVKARCMLDVLVGPKGKIFGKPAAIAGLRLDPSDLAWTWGDGPEVRGPAEAIIMAYCGRSAALGDLSGAGAETFRSRLATS